MHGRASILRFMINLDAVGICWDLFEFVGICWILLEIEFFGLSPCANTGCPIKNHAVRMFFFGPLEDKFVARTYRNERFFF